MRQIW